MEIGTQWSGIPAGARAGKSCCGPAQLNSNLRCHVGRGFDAFVGAGASSARYRSADQIATANFSPIAAQ